MVFLDVGCSEVSVWIYCNFRWVGSFMREDAIEEGFTRRRCHLTTICIACGLDLVGYCHCLGSDGFLPWILRVSSCNT